MSILQHVTRPDGLRVDLDSTTWGGTRVTLWSPQNPGQVYEKEDFSDPAKAMECYYRKADNVLRREVSRLGCVLTLSLGETGYVVELVRSARFYGQHSSKHNTPSVDRANSIYELFLEEMQSEEI